MIKAKKVWMDDKFVDFKKARIHVLTHTFHYGDGVFEGIRFYKTKKGPAIFRLKDHIDRLFYSAKSMGMKIPYSKEHIIKTIIKLLKVNKLKQGYIRPLVYRGFGMGLHPKTIPVKVLIAAWPWGSYLGERAVKVKISKVIRLHPKSTDSIAKISGGYYNSVLASIDATNSGYQEALLLDYQGNIAEGPGENFFIVKNKVIKTPSKSNILPGITRDSIIRIARDYRYRVKECILKPNDVYNADEAFFTGTAAEISAIGQIDKHKISNGKVGSVSKELHNLFLDVVHGRNKKYEKWLTYVE